MTYRDGVYDITEYLTKHPGGKLIVQAAGGPVDGWWKHWAQHHLSPEAAAALEALRIGRLLCRSLPCTPGLSQTHWTCRSFNVYTPRG